MNIDTIAFHSDGYLALCYLFLFRFGAGNVLIQGGIRAFGTALASLVTNA